MKRFLICFMVCVVFVSTFSAQPEYPVITSENAALLRPLSILPVQGYSVQLQGFTEDKSKLILQNGMVYDFQTGVSTVPETPVVPALYASERRAEMQEDGQTADIFDRGGLDPIATVKLPTRTDTPIFNPKGDLITSYIRRNGYYWYADNTATVLYSVESGEPVATLPGTNPAFSQDGTLLATTDNRVIYVFAVEAPPLTSVRISASVVPNVITLREAPSHDAQILRNNVMGTVMIAAASEDGRYVYAPELDGWLRSGEDYLRFSYGLNLGWLPVIDAGISFTPYPTVTPTLTSTPYPTYVPPTATPTWTPVSTSTPAPTLQGAVAIEADNIEAITRLAVLEGIMCTRTCQTSRSGFTLGGHGFITVADRQTALRHYSLGDLAVKDTLAIAEDYPVSAVSPDGKLAYFEDTPNLIHIIDAATWEKLSQIDTRGDIDTLVFSPDGNFLFVGYPTYSTVYNFTMPGNYRSISVSGNTAKFSPDSRYVAVLNPKNKTRTVYGTAQYSPSFQFPLPIQDIEFSPDSQSAATRDNNFVRVWDIEANTVTERFKIPVYYNASMMFRPDGEVLAVVTGGEIRLYDTEKGELLQIYPDAGTPGYNSDFAFSPDSCWLVVVPSLRLIDMETNTVYPLDSRGTDRVAFSPDSTRLLAGTRNQIEVWGIQ
jgi:hypothetical protein